LTQHIGAPFRGKVRNARLDAANLAGLLIWKSA